MEKHSRKARSARRDPKANSRDSSFTHKAQPVDTVEDGMDSDDCNDNGNDEGRPPMDCTDWCQHPMILRGCVVLGCVTLLNVVLWGTLAVMTIFAHVGQEANVAAVVPEMPGHATQTLAVQPSLPLSTPSSPAVMAAAIWPTTAPAPAEVAPLALPPPSTPPPSTLPPLPTASLPRAQDHLTTYHYDGEGTGPRPTLSERWQDAVPASNLWRAGLLIHQFDNTEADSSASQSTYVHGHPKHEVAPWLPCPVDAWCGKYADRLSATLVSKQLPFTFNNNAGMILAPNLAKVFCSYFNDGGTMAKQCTDASHPACVPGCSNEHTQDPNWCEVAGVDPTDNGAHIYDCAFRPADLETMLKHHQSAPYTYNEVVISTDQWAEKLPDSIEAFFFVAGNDDPMNEPKARQVYAEFHKRYPAAMTKLIQLDIHSSTNAVTIIEEPPTAQRR